MDLPYVGLEDIEGHTGRFVGPIGPRTVQSTTFRFTREHVLYGRLRPYLNKVLAPDFEGHCSTEIIPLVPAHSVVRAYLFYWLSSPATVHLLNATATGARMPRANLDQVLALEVPVPSVSEQRRIVAILDEAFEGIATAKAHAERNLQNAREVFDCHIAAIFSNSKEGWSSKAFEDCIEDVKYTSKVQRKEFLAAGAFPVISQESEFVNGYWDKVSDVFRINRPLVVFGDHTQVLKYIDFDFVLGADGVKLLVPKSFLHPKFFYYALRAAPLRSLGYARHYRLLKELQIGFPSVPEQVSVADRLDEVVEEVQRLGRIYAQKIDLLASLTQSLLHHAFSGAL
jgi:type I restriction enzyme S subunit